MPPPEKPNHEHLLVPDPLLGGATLVECIEVMRALRGRLAWLDEQIARAESDGDPGRRTRYALSRAVCVLALRQTEYRAQAYEDACRPTAEVRHTAVDGQDGRVQRSGIELAQQGLRTALAAYRNIRDAGPEEGQGLAGMEVRGRA